MCKRKAMCAVDQEAVQKRPTVRRDAGSVAEIRHYLETGIDG
jgi:hypothetical protein